VTALAPPAVLVLAALALVVPTARSGELWKQFRPMGSTSFHAAETRVATPPLSGATARRAAAAAAGLCGFVVVGGFTGLVAGVLVFGAVERVLARLPDASAARERAEVGRDLPIALDLLACVLHAGQPPSSASAVVGAAIGGPVGAALNSVARACVLGASAQIAWEPIGRLAGASATAHSMARAAHSGTALAEELGRGADHLRAAREAAAEAKVRRVGVLVVLPLGLCFLPAFICVGVLPLVAGVAGTVLH